MSRRLLIAFFVSILALSPLLDSTTAGAANFTFGAHCVAQKASFGFGMRLAYQCSPDEEVRQSGKIQYTSAGVSGVRDGLITESFTIAGLSYTTSTGGPHQFALDVTDPSVALRPSPVETPAHTGDAVQICLSAAELDPDELSRAGTASDLLAGRSLDDSPVHQTTCTDLRDGRSVVVLELLENKTYAIYASLVPSLVSPVPPASTASCVVQVSAV